MVYAGVDLHRKSSHVAFLADDGENNYAGRTVVLVSPGDPHDAGVPRATRNPSFRTSPKTSLSRTRRSATRKPA
jgi:hypothetical protein